MAELIDKRTARKIIEKYFQSLAPSHYDKMDLEEASVYLDAEIAELPTKTEAEIRASAYDRFLTEMLNEFDSRNADIEEYTGSYVVSRLHAVAEQLKERQ